MSTSKTKETAGQYLQKFLDSKEVGILVKNHTYRALRDARKKLGLTENEIQIIERGPYGRQKKARVFIINRRIDLADPRWNILQRT